jgi:hypothetical protein
MTANPESAHLCRTCLTPLSSHAATDPLLSITARMDTFSKASNAPRRPIVLAGMWLIFGPVAFFCLIGAAVIGWSLVNYPSLQDLVALLPMLLFLFIAMGLLYKTTANYVRTPPADAGRFPLVEVEENPGFDDPESANKSDE